MPIFEKALGIVDLPRIPTGSLRARLAALEVPVVDGADGVGNATVIVLPDVFTAYIDPDVLDATIHVLRAVGERPALAPFLPSGKFDHVKGRRRKFAQAAAQQRELRYRLLQIQSAPERLLNMLRLMLWLLIQKVCR